MAKVLREFDYSFDGVTALKAKIGDDIDFGDMTVGLVAEDYVAADAAPVTPAVVNVESTAPDAEAEPAPEPEPEPKPSPKRNRK